MPLSATFDKSTQETVFTCPYHVWKDAAGRHWRQLNSFLTHIQNVHLSAPQSPPPLDFLALYNRTVCEKCNLITLSGKRCSSCKHFPGLAIDSMPKGDSTRFVRSPPLLYRHQQQFYRTQEGFWVTCPEKRGQLGTRYLFANWNMISTPRDPPECPYSSERHFPAYQEEAAKRSPEKQYNSETHPAMGARGRKGGMARRESLCQARQTKAILIQ